MYNIFDFKGVIKHSYFGCRNQARETIYCEETDTDIIPWYAGANDFLSRYLEPLDTFRTLIVAHDMGSDFRKSFHPGYKANRKAKDKKTSPVQKEQLEKLERWAKQLLSAIGATQIGVKGVEADDIIAWVAQGQGVTAVIHTVDGDLVRLASPQIMVKLKDEFFFEDDLYKGYHPTVLTVQKSIVGDTSDDYPGIKGMGARAFESLHETLGSSGVQNLETIIEEQNFDALVALADKHGTKELHKLVDNWSEWIDQYRLARLHPELCYKPRARQLVKPIIHKRVPNPQQVYDLLKAVGAQDLWHSKFSKMVPGVLAVDNKVWANAKDKVYELMKASDLIAFDYESTDFNQIESFRQASNRNFVDVLSHKITGASFCFGEQLENVIYMTFDHKDADNIPLNELKELLAHLLEIKKGNLVAHNATFEGVLTKTNLGLQLHGVKDTRIMQRYFNENESAGLEDMSSAYLNYNQKSYVQTLQEASEMNTKAALGISDEEWDGWDDKEKTEKVAEHRVTGMNELTLEQVLKYGTDDALVTAHLADLMKLLLQLDQQWTHYEQWCVDPTVALQNAYTNGVTINWKLQAELQANDEKQIEQRMADLRKLLEENVTGQITEGCLSYIEAETKYMKRSLEAKFPEDHFSRFNTWKRKLEEACIYVPYSEQEVMPDFAFTPKQLNAAAEKIGLPPIEKVTLRALGEYLDNLGITKAEATVYEGVQDEFIQALSNAVTERVDKLGKEPTILRQKAFDRIAEVTQRLAGVEPKIAKLGDELNVNSSDQMRALLYCKIGVPVLLYSSSLGKGRKDLGVFQAGPATDEDAIKTALAMSVEKGTWQYSALEALLDIKSATTRLSLFHNKMPLWKHLDGRIHPSILDSGTDTRRPTGSAPNVLQIPSKGVGARMRGMYMPPSPDYVCVAIDYNGQELRLTADESQDPVMMRAYQAGSEQDLHSVMGSGIAKDYPELQPIWEYEAFNKARKDETHVYHAQAKDIRESKAKGVNFGLAYGAAAPTLARNLIIALSEAEKLETSAFATYARLKAWQEETANFMNRNGFTQTAFGTRRHATDDLFSSDRGLVASMHRRGTNFTIQGTAAEMLKIVLTKMWTEGVLNLRMEFFAPIYDEVVSWVHKDDVYDYCVMMKEIMASAKPEKHTILQVPEISIGYSWGHLHEIGRTPTPENVTETLKKVLEEGKEVWETQMLNNESEEEINAS